MAATEVADVPFLRRKKKVKTPSPQMVNAEARLEDLRRRVKALENVKTVVTISTRSRHKP